tara:strand:+ start:63 stop:458 length:396 start_codon:yes stop_codon:yes gene_type:complete
VEVLVPSKSKKQHRFMKAVANNPDFAKEVGVPQSVGREYEKADKGKTFSGGKKVSSKRMKAVEEEVEEMERVKKRRSKDPKERKDKKQEMKRIRDEEGQTLRDMRMNKGGKVRGCGIASRGVRPTKMVKMG